MASALKTIVVPPLSGSAPTASCFILHGLGDTGAGWYDVAQMLSQRPKLRHVRFILPNAPIQPVTLNGGMKMSSWFDILTLEDIQNGEDEAGLNKSAAYLKALVAKEVEQGISHDRIVVGGFSQGGAVSYLAGLTHAPPLGGIMALSTWLPLRKQVKPKVSSEITSTAVFAGHGTHDPVVRYEYGQRSANFIRDDLGLGEAREEAGKLKGVRFESYARMPHSACAEEIEHMGQWLEKVLPSQS